MPNFNFTELIKKHRKGDNMANPNESGKDPGTTRREFLKNTGRIAATSALAAGLAPRIYAAGSGMIKVALVGCGGRGTGAASDALSVKNGPIKLVAMSDVFQNRLDRSYQNLEKGHAQQLDVPKERQFLGFDGYKKAMDCLDKGDVVILATPPAFRWVHFTYAIAKGVNVIHASESIDAAKREVDLWVQALGLSLDKAAAAKAMDAYIKKWDGRLPDNTTSIQKEAEDVLEAIEDLKAVLKTETTESDETTRELIRAILHAMMG
jgi:hypothetical protein